VVESLDRTARAILTALVEGRELTLLVRRLKRSRTALHYDKERLGHDILQQVQARPAWQNSLEAVQERLTCRADRRAA
jgi:hypothetical protein